ncbi:hypothetical protein HPP92_001618 [Vanilla planifolia]|uniref:O-fucosyltransferase family protein n=1 Tax=Vanilla planifolia TaxID=51239 RepID=A0A835VFI4_VANPL|nr:hypothetical protein HPP92_001618 [Vanilla planifolia]
MECRFGRRQSSRGLGPSTPPAISPGVRRPRVFMENKGEKEREWGKSLPHVVYHFSSTGGAVAVATAVTHPLDVLKVRLQTQLVGQRGPLVGMAEIFEKIVEVEGARGLYLGLMPALTRSVLYGGLRLGLYEPCKYFCDLMFGSTNFFIKIASGAVSGALATALTNPMEVLKVRLQMNSKRGMIREMRKISSDEGFKALWKGVGPAMARASALTASQLATYDESKQVLLRWKKLEEGFHLHLISSCIAGTVGTLVTAPLDMIKTRLMLQNGSNGNRTYRNGYHCAYQVVLTEGFRALYKGGFATFARLGPQTTITFLVCEKLRELAARDLIQYRPTVDKFYQVGQVHRILDIENYGDQYSLWKHYNHMLILEIPIQICDLVAISRLLNATLVIPEIQESLRSKGISSIFKSFSYVYNEEQFIAALSNDVVIVKSLPYDLRQERRKNKYPTFSIRYLASPSFYVREVLPKLKQSKVVGLLIGDGGCLESVLPPDMEEYQRLRCRVAFHALQFRSEIQVLGNLIVERLRASGRPWSFHIWHSTLVLQRTQVYGNFMVVFMVELFQDVHTELIQYKRKQLIKRGIVHGNLSVDSFAQKKKGLCPLMPEEVGIFLRAIGYPSDTIIYLAGAEVFGGQRILVPLRAMYPNLVDRSSLCSKAELSKLLGPESALLSELPMAPPQKTKEQLIEEWNRAGPRPRPLPPPPARPFYQHEKVGWYGWVAESDVEPDPSAIDLRMQSHRLIWNALDYYVSVEADAFFPGFHSDGSSWPDFASLVIGHRLYQMASARTFRPDRRTMVKLLDSIRDNMYHPKHNWTLLVRQHLNNSLGIGGLIMGSQASKPRSFLSHPLPECSCRVSRASEAQRLVKGPNGEVLYGGEDRCPEWMVNGLSFAQRETRDAKDEGDDLPEEDSEMEAQEDSSDVSRTEFNRAIEQDEEMDPDD